MALALDCIRMKLSLPKRSPRTLDFGVLVMMPSRLAKKEKALWIAFLLLISGLWSVWWHPFLIAVYGGMHAYVQFRIWRGSHMNTCWNGHMIVHAIITHGMVLTQRLNSLSCRNNLIGYTPVDVSQITCIAYTAIRKRESIMNCISSSYKRSMVSMVASVPYSCLRWHACVRSIPYMEGVTHEYMLKWTHDRACNYHTWHGSHTATQ